MRLLLMNRRRLQFLALFLTAMPLFSEGSAQDIPDPMYPYRLVNDFAHIFSTVEQQALEQKLLAYNDSTSTQLYIITVSDMAGYAASDFAFRIGEKWKIGQKSKDNGAVILIKPPIGNSRGQAFIAMGYGLEAKINDAYAGRIVREQMIPYFMEEDYFGGANAAVDAMIARLSGEYSADKEEEDEGVPLIAILIILAVVILFFVLISRGGDQHIDGDGHHRSPSPPIFFPPLSGRRGGSFTGGGFGGGGFGGGIGGGFGGGGGGRFGGGGAGGSW